MYYLHLLESFSRKGGISKRALETPFKSENLREMSSRVSTSLPTIIHALSIPQLFLSESRTAL